MKNDMMAGHKRTQKLCTCVAIYLLCCKDSVRPISQEYATLWGLAVTCGLRLGWELHTNINIQDLCIFMCFGNG